MARLYAVSDLHVAHPENRAVVEGLFPEDEGDWLLLAGDVGELAADVEWTLRLLADRFSTVVWVPGNHELWTHPADPVRLRGEHRYRYLVELSPASGCHHPRGPLSDLDRAGRSRDGGTAVPAVRLQLPAAGSA